MIRHPWRYLLYSLLTAWLVDFLFWHKSAGISFLIWVTVLLLGSILLARSEDVKFSRQSFFLYAAILVLAAVVFFRREPFTVGLSILLSLGLIWLLASTLTNGYWVRFRIIDYISEGFRSAGAAMVRPLELFKRNSTGTEGDVVPQKKKSGSLWPFLRGLLLALPVLIVLGGLLVAADPIFSAWVEDFFQFFRIEWKAEFVFRFVYILIFAYLFSGLYLYALKPKHVMQKPDPDKPMIKGFLGWTETAVVLVSVNLLFAIFLFVQIRYFFGGQANINETGFTYAEYARRGFNELLAVAVLSLLLYQGLGIIANLGGRSSRIGFTGLSLLLIAQVMVILVSAFQRLMMYEQAYGFTRLRTVSHGFMIWLAVLLAAVLVLEIAGRRGWFTLAVLVCMFGFTVSLAIVNVDGQIVRRNIARTSLDKLDVEYLKELSNDAVPVMADLFKNSEETELRDQLGMQLACRKKILDEEVTPWQMFTWSEMQARRILTGMGDTLSGYPVKKIDGEWVVAGAAGEQSCYPQVSYFDPVMN